MIANPHAMTALLEASSSSHRLDIGSPEPIDDEGLPPAAKRPRYHQHANDTSNTTTTTTTNATSSNDGTEMDIDGSMGMGALTLSPTLPPFSSLPSISTDSWADILQYLPFRDMLELTSTTSFMLEVSSKLTNLCVDEWLDIRHRCPRDGSGPFASVKSLEVGCLLRPAACMEEEYGHAMCEETCTDNEDSMCWAEEESCLTSAQDCYCYEDDVWNECDDGGQYPEDDQQPPPMFQICPETSAHLIPFLASFPSLEIVWVGGIAKRVDRAHITNTNTNHNNTNKKRKKRMKFGYDQNYLYDRMEENDLDHLLKDVCGAYDAGILDVQRLRIRGLVDTVDGATGARGDYAAVNMKESEGERREEMTSNAQMLSKHHCVPDYCSGACSMICQSFPLRHVLHLHRHCLCLSYGQRLAALADRPGGRDVIVSHGVHATFDSHRYAQTQPIQIRVDAEGHPSEVGEFRVDVIQYDRWRVERPGNPRTDLWDDLEEVLRYGVDPAGYDFAKLERHFPIDASTGGTGTGSIGMECAEERMRSDDIYTGRASHHGKLYMTEFTFDLLVEFGFDLHPSDFRKIVRPEEVRAYNLSGLQSLPRLPGSVALIGSN